MNFELEGSLSLSFQDAGQAGIVDVSVNEIPPLTVEAELELRVRYAGSGQWSESWPIVVTGLDASTTAAGVILERH